jgi:hypothetical protein
MIAPSITTPELTYFQSATSSLRASATICRPSNRKPAYFATVGVCNIVAGIPVAEMTSFPHFLPSHIRAKGAHAPLGFLDPDNGQKLCDTPEGRYRSGVRRPRRSVSPVKDRSRPPPTSRKARGRAACVRRRGGPFRRDGPGSGRSLQRTALEAVGRGPLQPTDTLSHRRSEQEPNANVVASIIREKLAAMGAKCFQLVVVRHAKAVVLDLNFAYCTAFTRERTGLRRLLRHTTTSSCIHLAIRFAILALLGALWKGTANSRMSDRPLVRHAHFSWRLIGRVRKRPLCRALMSPLAGGGKAPSP